MKGRCDDGIAVNPWASQQQIVGRISINDITYHLRLQVSDLTFELDLTHRVHTIGVESIESSLSDAQPMGGNLQVLHDPAGYNTQYES